MAYIPSYVDEDEEKKVAQPTSEVAPQAATGALAGASTAPKSLADKGYVGIGQYLEANKDQAQGLADRVLAPIGQKVSEAQSAQDQYAKDWEADYQKRTRDWARSADKTQTGLNTEWQKQLDDAYYNWQRTPEKVAPTAPLGTSKYSSLRAEREAAYNDLLKNAPRVNAGVAPTPSAYTPDTSLAQSADVDLSALGTAGGRGALLEDLATGPYSAGARGLDAALLGMSDVGAAGEKYAGILEALRNPTAPEMPEARGQAVAPTRSRAANEAAQLAYEQRLERERQAAANRPGGSGYRSKH